MFDFYFISDLYHAIEQHPEHGDFTLAICPGGFELSWGKVTKPKPCHSLAHWQTSFNLYQYEDFWVFSTVHFQRFQFKSKRHREQQWVSVHSSGGLQRSTAWVSGEKSQNKNCRRNLKRCVNRCEQNSAFNIIHVRCVCLTILEPLPRCRSQAPGFSCGWTSLKCKPLSPGLPCWWSF